MQQLPYIKIYKSFGSAEKIMIVGHVLEKPSHIFSSRNTMSANIFSLMKLFAINTIPHVVLRLKFQGESYETKSEFDGFFKFDFKPVHSPSVGWHPIRVELIDEQGEQLTFSEGEMYVPHMSQYTFISDIDDTIMKSYSATIFKRLYELLLHNPVQRRLFDNTAKFYTALAESNTTEGLLNPFFYVSSSEWNLYDYLNTVFTQNELPKGVFLLNSYKKLKSFIQTGKHGHEGKLIRIARIISAFPRQRIVLLGDNSQKDPEIYAAIAEKYPQSIHAVIIRNVRKEKVASTRAFLKNIQYLGIHAHLFNTTQDAISYCRDIGLIHDRP